MNKAQTATEYLIILAVVIVIALIVVGVLGGIPGIGGGVSERQARLQLATEEVAIQDYISSSLNTKLVVQNNKPESIKITDITINNKKCSFKDTVLRAGQKTTIDCFGVRSFSQGEKFSYPTELTYQDMSLGGSYTIEYPVPLVGISQGGSRLHTGQLNTQCTNGNSGPFVPCTSAHTGQDGYDDGTAKSFTETTTGVVLDRHTGLQWTRDIVSSGVNWTNAVTNCSGLSLAGGGWRLPNIVEFTSVLSSGASSITAPLTWDVSTMRHFWTSTSVDADPNYAFKTYVGAKYFYGSWWVSTGSRDANGIHTNTNAQNRVVCVRGETTHMKLVDKPKNFQDIGNDMIVDHDTGLVWTKNIYYNASGYWDWALNHCNSLNMGGFTDWRLPTVSEGVTLIDYGCTSAGSGCFGIYKNSAFLYDGEGYDDYSWTGTTRPSYVANAYYLNLAYGQVNNVGKSSVVVAVRCVRDHD